MTTVARDSGGSDFKPVPAGAHAAVCDQVVDLGIQDGGQYDPRQKIYLRWQIPSERVSWEKDGKRQEGPAIIGRTFSLSLSEKSHLRPLLESWRGRPFTQQELKGFDIKNVLGHVCMIQVTHKQDQAGRTFGVVASVISLPKTMPKPQAEGDLLYFDSDHPDEHILSKLSKNVRDKVGRRMTADQAIKKMARGGSDTEDPGYDEADTDRTDNEAPPF